MRQRTLVRVTVAIAVLTVLAGVAAAAIAGSTSPPSSAPPTTSLAPPTRESASPSPSSTASATASRSPSRKPTPAASPSSSPAATRAAAPVDPCTTPAARGAAATDLLHDRTELRGVTVRFAEGRSGVLAESDGASTVTVYVRSCADEPLREVAAAMVHEVAQLRELRYWTSADRSRWERLRGISEPWGARERQDVGAVAVLWQLDTTRWWQSSFPAPSGELDPGLVTLLRRT